MGLVDKTASLVGGVVKNTHAQRSVLTVIFQSK